MPFAKRKRFDWIRQKLKVKVTSDGGKNHYFSQTCFCILQISSDFGA